MNRFISDHQTLEDLNILSKPGRDSIYAIFNAARTRGGAEILEEMFLNPLADADAINKRCAMFKFFQAMKINFPFRADDITHAEVYLQMTDRRSMLSANDNGVSKKFSQLISADGDYKTITNGIKALLQILQTLNNFIEDIEPLMKHVPYQGHVARIRNLLAQQEIPVLLQENAPFNFPHVKFARLDKFLRFDYREVIKDLLKEIYTLDCLISVSDVAQKNGYSFPTALNTDSNEMMVSGVYHPLVKNAKSNSIHISEENNVIFLTGANMAGKSTFMKSLGIAVYLAHLGFPVAAKEMTFSVKDGIYTTINLPDDLHSGTSHFYAEVMRLKKVAKELATGKRLFIIFDELFRGTNVKDAYDGTVEVTRAFAGRHNCMFVVSTHIVEAGETLKHQCNNIKFVYLPTLMDGNKPVYTYRLEEGITADKHGMIIINNERILEIIRSRNNNTRA